MANSLHHLPLKVIRPDLRIFFPDSVDQIDSEIKVNRFVSQDVLKLFADASHYIAPVERKNHDESSVEENAFHDDIVADEILEKGLGALHGFCGEIRIEHLGGKFHFEFVLACNGRNFTVHIENLTLVKPEAFDDVEKRMRMDGFFECLA